MGRKSRVSRPGADAGCGSVARRNATGAPTAALPARRGRLSPFSHHPMAYQRRTRFRTILLARWLAPRSVAAIGAGGIGATVILDPRVLTSPSPDPLFLTPPRPAWHDGVRCANQQPDGRPAGRTGPECRRRIGRAFAAKNAPHVRRRQGGQEGAGGEAPARAAKKVRSGGSRREGSLNPSLLNPPLLNLSPASSLRHQSNPRRLPPPARQFNRFRRSRDH